jgi:excisionase family DNA binding protein
MKPAEEAPQRLTVSIKHAADLIDVNKRTMWRLIADGRVETIKVGRRRLVLYSSLEELVQENARREPGKGNHQDGKPSSATIRDQ